MSWELHQHFFNCSWRANFETVGVTRGFPPQLVRELEERARYPAKEEWKDSGEGSPRILRGFQLSSGQWAVSALSYVGAGLDRHEGNYLAHSVLVPSDLLDYVLGNAAFLAVLLPQHPDYTPQSTVGADTVEALSIASLDPNRQFRFFEFCLKEMGTNVCARLLRVIVAGLSDPEKSLVLEFPPPSGELARLYGEVLGAPEGAIPTADMLRLLRLSGLTSILPAAFKQRLSFSVNDLAVGYAVRIPRAWGATTEDPAPWAWFEHCVGLAGGQGDVRLHDLVSWLSRLMPSGCPPSIAALDAGFELWRERSQAASEHSDTAPVRFDRFRHCVVNFDFLMEELSEPNSQPGADVTLSDDLLIQLSDFASSGAGGLSPRLYSILLRRITPDRGDNSLVTAARRDLFLKLPVSARIELWNRTWKAGEFPGQIRNSERDLDFLASTFQPDLGLDRNARQGILERLVTATIERGEAAVRGPACFGDVARPVRLALIAMMKFDRPANILMREVGLRLANRYRVLWEGQRRDSQWVRSSAESPLDEAGRLVGQFLPGASEAFVFGLVEFAVELCGQRAENVLQIAQRLPFERQSIAGTRLFLRQVADRVDRPGFSGLPMRYVQALIELADLLENPALHGPDEGLDHAFRAYVRLLKAAESHRVWGDVAAKFLGQVEEAVRSLRPIDRLPVALGYLWFNDRSSQYLLGLAASAISSADPTLAAWLAAGRVGYLVKFIRVADARDSWYASSAWEPVDRLLRALEPRRSLDVLRELEDRLSRTDVRGEVKKRVRQTKRDLEHRQF